ncbi:PDZ domain-containing protein 2 [Lepisosteus oculatus]|uniref:PDZ domain-containing protein 2 n=1 Tax=Lepisosteus oculatus TaxID=7918 RepID=UPI0035F52624
MSLPCSSSAAPVSCMYFITPHLCLPLQAELMLTLRCKNVCYIMNMCIETTVTKTLESVSPCVSCPEEEKSKHSDLWVSKGCKNTISKVSSNCSSHSWNMSGIRWASLSGKERLYGGHSLRLFPVSDRARGYCSSPEQEAEEISNQTEEDAAANFSLSFSDPEYGPKRHRHHKGDHRENRRIPKPRAFPGGLANRRLPSSVPACNAAAEKNGQGGFPERGPADKPTSKVPLKLQIKVCSQRGSLGISIAGGKGSAPYYENDEGIFISRVSKGGPAERAGARVGDRLLEVNGVNMQTVSHHEAVSTLRNAGSCIKMTVLRQRAHGLDSASVQETESIKGRKCSEQRSPQRRELGLEHSLSEMKETPVCNGNGSGLSESEEDQSRIASDTEAAFQNNVFPTVQNTMTIPRIILTHPSTSDEDVEQLTQDPVEEEPDELDSADNQTSSGCSTSVFYLP